MSSRMLMIALRLLVFIAFESLNADAFVSELRLSGTANMAPITVPRRNVRRHASEKEEWGRRCFLVATTAACLTVPLEYSWASDLRDRVTGYTLQKSDGEWKQSLTSKQYFVLREGGTEKPYSSPLEKEKRAGTFACAGCGVPLFSSEAKFNSGTGWPSFATALAAVEEEKVLSGVCHFKVGKYLHLMSFLRDHCISQPPYLLLSLRRVVHHPPLHALILGPTRIHLLPSRRRRRRRQYG